MPYQPGIYFSLPFEEYCKIPAMNASRLKLELVSPMDAWARSSANPVRDEIDDETKAKNEGRIYHKLILEGREEFDKVYAPEFEVDPDDKTIIKTSEEIKGALAKVGAPVSFKVKNDGIARLIDADPKARIYDLMEAEHRKQFPGREFIPARLHREVQLHDKVIKYNPELRKWLMGGYPEVTVIWEDPELGLVFKIRIDYLKIRTATDLKSFANSKMKKVKLAIMDAIAAQKYHIQMSLYLRGIAQAKALTSIGQVFNIEDGKPVPMDETSWLADFADSPVESFNFLFIQKGPAPVAMGFRALPGSAVDKAGMNAIQDAVRSHLEAKRNFGDDPPVNLAPSEELQMDELPAYINNV